MVNKGTPAPAAKPEHHFRPTPLLAPGLATTQAQYQQYLANYDLYLTANMRLKEKFWYENSQGKHSKAPPLDIVSVDHPTLQTGPQGNKVTVHHFREHVRYRDSLDPTVRTVRPFGARLAANVVVEQPGSLRPKPSPLSTEEKRARRKAANRRRRLRKKEQRLAIRKEKAEIASKEVQIARTFADVLKIGKSVGRTIQVPAALDLVDVRVKTLASQARKQLAEGRKKAKQAAHASDVRGDVVVNPKGNRFERRRAIYGPLPGLQAAERNSTDYGQDADEYDED